MRSVKYLFISVQINQLSFGTKMTRQVLKHLNCIANVGSLKVFDRWGRQVYSESNLAPVPEITLWKPSEPGIYFYQLTVNIVAGEPEQFLRWVEVK